MRLLICMDCKTIEEIPDYDGPLETARVPSPDGTLMEAQVPPVGADHLLDHISYPHRKQEHRGQLVQVEEEKWRDHVVRNAILKELQEQLKGSHTGLDPEAYAIKNTFQQDALKCFAKHNRPKDGCIDWEDKSKILGNSLLTEEEKDAAREHHLLNRGSGSRRYLCHFCPVASQVKSKMFDKSGMYN